MYVKVKNNQVMHYPYTGAELQFDNPFTNLNGLSVFDAFQGTEENLAGATLEPVTVDEAPSYDQATHNAIRSTTPILRDGVWAIEWTVVPKTSEELAQQTTAKASEMRSQRNVRLANCDWTQLPDSTVDKAAWATYRQALRDITTQAGFPWTITWPETP